TRSSKPPARTLRASAASSGGPCSAQNSSTGRAAGGTADSSAARMEDCAFNSPAANTSTSAEPGCSCASARARWSGPTITHHFPIPARMVQPRPRLAYRSPGDGAEGARLGGGAEVDVPDDGDEERDERQIVQQDGDGPQRLREVGGPP